MLQVQAFLQLPCSGSPAADSDAGAGTQHGRARLLLDHGSELSQSMRIRRSPHAMRAHHASLKRRLAWGIVRALADARGRGGDGRDGARALMS